MAEGGGFPKMNPAYHKKNDPELQARKLFVGGLSYVTRRDSLGLFFQQFGGVEDVEIITDFPRPPYAFVIMTSRDGFDRARANPHPILDGAEISVGPAKDRYCTRTGEERVQQPRQRFELPPERYRFLQPQSQQQPRYASNPSDHNNCYNRHNRPRPQFPRPNTVSIGGYNNLDPHLYSSIPMQYHQSQPQPGYRTPMTYRGLLQPPSSNWNTYYRAGLAQALAELEQRQTPRVFEFDPNELNLNQAIDALDLSRASRQSSRPTNQQSFNIRGNQNRPQSVLNVGRAHQGLFIGHGHHSQDSVHEYAQNLKPSSLESSSIRPNHQYQNVGALAPQISSFQHDHHQNQRASSQSPAADRYGQFRNSAGSFGRSSSAGTHDQNQNLGAAGGFRQNEDRPGPSLLPLPSMLNPNAAEFTPVSAGQSLAEDLQDEQGLLNLPVQDRNKMAEDWTKTSGGKKGFILSKLTPDPWSNAEEPQSDNDGWNQLRNFEQTPSLSNIREAQATNNGVWRPLANAGQITSLRTTGQHRGEAPRCTLTNHSPGLLTRNSNPDPWAQTRMPNTTISSMPWND